jgi:hypothetical protein
MTLTDVEVGPGRGMIGRRGGWGARAAGRGWKDRALTRILDPAS